MNINWGNWAIICDMLHTYSMLVTGGPRTNFYFSRAYNDRLSAYDDVEVNPPPPKKKSINKKKNRKRIIITTVPG